jgi:hypothetical protein
MTVDSVVCMYMGMQDITWFMAKFLQIGAVVVDGGLHFNS